MPVPEATVTDTPEGKAVRGEGWFVLNAAEAQWIRHETAGTFLTFESPEARFAEYGVNIHVVEPGQPNALYHREEAQEDFLVLSGECILVIEGEERLLKAWDFAHCPAWTEHVIVGAGDGPCAILMMGARGGERGLCYPVNDVAAKYGASVAKETESGKEAYAHWASAETPMRMAWPLPLARAV
jgi:uncharacterized cupin superfamily protein